MALEIKLKASLDPEFYKKIDQARIEIKKLSIALQKIDKRSRFEKFYDFMTDLLSNGKSFAPKELKQFR